MPKMPPLTPMAQTISATISVNIVEPGTLGVTVTVNGGLTPSDWLPIVRDWVTDRLQMHATLVSLREPSRRLAQATDGLSAALAGMSSAVPLTRKRALMTVADDLATLIAEMTEATTEMDAAVTYIDSVPDMIAAAVAAALANGATAAELEPVTTLGTTLAAKAAALKASLVPKTTS